MYATGPCSPSYLCIPPRSGLTIEAVANYILSAPDAALTINSLHLDPHDLSDPIENGAALVTILRHCPNLQQLHIRMSRAALDALAAAGIVLGQLQIARLQIHDPNPYSVAAFLAGMPNLRGLVFAVLGATIREDEASVRYTCQSGILSHLEEYAQANMSRSYQAPTYSAARTLRVLSLDLFTAFRDLSHLAALTYLRVQVVAQGERLLGTDFVAVLASLRRLRHLEIGYATRMEDAVFAAVATIGPQLLTLRLRTLATAAVALNSLTRTLPRLLQGPLPSLRSLTIEGRFADQEEWDTLSRVIGGMLRARRVALEIFEVMGGSS